MNRYRSLMAASLLSMLMVAPRVEAEPRALGQEETVAIPFVSSGWSASRFVSAEAGGVIEIEGVARLTIPANALESDRVVSMLAELVEVNGERFVVVTFGPSGTAFRIPVKLELWPRLVRKANLDASLFYSPGLDENGDLEWSELALPQQSDDNGQRLFVVWLDHFSRYGVGYDLRIVLSGFVWNVF